MDERQLLKHFHAEAEELIEALLADVELLAGSVDTGRQMVEAFEADPPALLSEVASSTHSVFLWTARAPSLPTRLDRSSESLPASFFARTSIPLFKLVSNRSMP